MIHFSLLTPTVLLISLSFVFASIIQTEGTQKSDNEEDDNGNNSNDDCDSSYPDVCITSYPPDLNCDDISKKNFKVLSPDPHGFDREEDGIGCES